MPRKKIILAFFIFVMLLVAAPIGAQQEIIVPELPIRDSDDSVLKQGASALAVQMDLQRPISSKLDPTLYFLAEEYQRYLSSDRIRPFDTSVSNVTVIGASATPIEVITLANADSVAEDLKAIGLQNVFVAGSVINGILPLNAIPQLETIPNLTFARYPFVHADVGLTTSQGVAAMDADEAIVQNGNLGSGVTVGILSNSFDCYGLPGAPANPPGYTPFPYTTYADDVGSGDLPSGINTLLEGPCTYSSSTDEGRAMAQIVHDVAPNATLAFHTAFGGQATYAAGIEALQDEAVANGERSVIVDDVVNLAEPFFQDGIIAQAVDSVVGQGAVYFGSAGNRDQSAYQGTWSSSATTALPDGYTRDGGYGAIHDFNPSGDTPYLEINLPNNVRFRPVLQWTDPTLSATSNGVGATRDLDMHLYVCTTSACTAFSQVIRSELNNDYLNGGNGDPLEILNYLNTSGSTQTVRFYITALDAGDIPTANDLIRFVDFGSAAPDNLTSTAFWTYSPTVNPHVNSSTGVAVGAAWYLYTVFTPQTLAENFSSVGNQLGDADEDLAIIFDTQGNRLTTPIVREQPRITAPDGVNTTFFTLQDPELDGFPNFFGTSAAAPHAAAVAALVLGENNALCPADVVTILENSAIDITTTDYGFADTEPERGQAGFDEKTGFGLIQADTAVTLAAAATPSFAFPYSLTGATNAERIANLNDAISCANANLTADTINMQGNALVVSDGENPANGDNIFASINTPITITNGSITDSTTSGFRFFTVTPTGTFTLDNVNLTNGGNALIPTGGAINNTGTLSISNSTLSGNRADILGGAIYNTNSLTLNNVTITQPALQAAADNGGGIYNAGTANLTDVTISNNRAADGGALYNGFGTTTISGTSSFSSNNATDDGGAIYGLSGAINIIGTTDFSLNSATNDGGAIYTSSATLSIDGTSFTTNTATFGGAMLLFAGADIDNATFNTNGVTTTGGAIYVGTNDTVNIDGSTFTGNTANFGGAIGNVGTSVFIANSDFLSNQANTGGSQYGGAIYSATGAVTSVDTAEIRGNTAIFGGGIFTFGTTYVTNSLISGNLSNQDGAGLLNAGTTILTNVTVSGNSALDDGGGVRTDAADLTLNNTIVAENFAADVADNVYINGAFSITEVNSTTTDGVATFVSRLVNTDTFPNIGGDYRIVAPNMNIIDQGDNTLDPDGVNPGVLPRIDDTSYTDLDGNFRVTDGDADGTATVDRGAYEYIAANCFATPDDGATLYSSLDNQAVQDAVNDPSAVTIKVAGDCVGTIDNSDADFETVSITKAITIIGGFNPQDWFTQDTAAFPTVLDATSANAGRVIEITTPLAVTLNGLTIQNGQAQDGGGIYAEAGSGTLTLTNVDITNNSATRFGGGIYSSRAMSITGGSLTNNTILGTGAVRGGGLYHLNATSTIDGMAINNNSAQSTDNGETLGGNVFNNGDLTISNTSVSSGQLLSLNSFGGSLLNRGGTLTLNNVEVSGSFAQVGGGGIANFSTDGAAGILNLNAGSVVGTMANPNVAGFGGGIYSEGTNNFDADTNVTGTTIQYNRAISYGGGVFSYLSATDILSSSVLDNNSASLGGGFFNYFGSTTINNSIVSNNRAIVTATIRSPQAFGGGGFNSGSASAEGIFNATDTVFDGNSAEGNGGGLWNGISYNATTLRGFANLTDVDFVNNTAANGGAIHNTYGGVLSGTRLGIGAYINSSNAVVTGANRATSGSGGGIYISGQTETNNAGTQPDIMEGMQAVEVDPLPILEFNLYHADNNTRQGDVTRMVLLPNAAYADILDSTIAGNTASVSGGGIYVNSTGGSQTGLDLSNATISGNDAPNGGGLQVDLLSGASTVAFHHVTIASNTGATGSGMNNVGGNTVTALNSILSGDTCVGVVGTSSYANPSTTCTGFALDSTLALGSLADNGGGTLTRALTLGDSVDGAASPCLSNDQRGLSRGIDINPGRDVDGLNCDAGAFEAQVGEGMFTSIIPPAPVNSPQPNSNLIAPIGQITETSPSLQWTEAEGAETYTVRLDGVATGNPNADITTMKKETFIDTTYNASEVCSRGICSIDISVTLEPGVYQWWVKPDTSRGNGQWSPPANFKVVDAPDAPVQIAPVNTTTSIMPIFTWQGDSEVQWYQLWVLDNDGTVFTRWYKLRDVCSGAVCIVQPTLELTDGEVHAWWVQAERRGAYSLWAGPSVFTVDSSQAITSADGVNNLGGVVAPVWNPDNASSGDGTGNETPPPADEDSDEPPAPDLPQRGN